MKKHLYQAITKTDNCYYVVANSISEAHEKVITSHPELVPGAGDPIVEVQLLTENLID